VAGSKPVRTIFTVIMDILIVVAIALTVRMVIMFFGQLAAQGWGEAVIALTNPFVFPFGQMFGFDALIATPYGGAFDADAALTVVALLVIEWMLSIVRSRA